MVPGTTSSPASSTPSSSTGATGPSSITSHANHGISTERSTISGPSLRGSSGLPGSMVSPAAQYDVQFTPLLPSQLLMGSPFQPGTPSGAFSNPQIAFPTSPTMTPGAFSPTEQYLPYQSYMDLASFSDLTAAAAAAASPQVVQASRTVYLGNVPSETTAEELLSHVHSGPVESVRMLPEKNCAFISFLDIASASHFHSDAILRKLSIRGQDIKIGWGKPSTVPMNVLMAVHQSNASRNVYLGNLPEDITEEEIREDLGRFGAIDTIKLVREKPIGFVHLLSISSAIKAVQQLPQDPKWANRKVFYGKDRCAYVSKTQQQNAAQFLGISPGYEHLVAGADRDMISNALAQQSAAAAAVATTAGGMANLGNRTVYLGSIHPDTTIEEICNVVRGGLLHQIRYIPDKHICFVTFVDPTAAAQFFAMSNVQGLMIHNRRLKIGWGKHSGPLPTAIALAVTAGASRNVYIGNIDESWTEERLRQDFSEYGEIELVNTLREKSCAFVNFTNIANAIKAIEGIKQKEEYRNFKINFGKDRCGNAPRPMNLNAGNHNHNGSSNGNAVSVVSPDNNGTTTSPIADVSRSS
ncbi:hypothetical protein V1525DRAFT_387781 [Lipomyces kononenkoae]|uniref:Uncharacterized protein n=1 Tax=Lipomyces kononenkoae TaxID=34357 RepID=A0ACC3T2Q8_LIPKO